MQLIEIPQIENIIYSLSITFLLPFSYLFSHLFCLFITQGSKEEEE